MVFQLRNSKRILKIRFRTLRKTTTSCTSLQSQHDLFQRNKVSSHLLQLVSLIPSLNLISIIPPNKCNQLNLITWITLPTLTSSVVGFQQSIMQDRIRVRKKFTRNSLWFLLNWLLKESQCSSHRLENCTRVEVIQKDWMLTKHSDPIKPMWKIFD